MYAAKDYDRAPIAPEQVFESPMDIVNADSMTLERKLTVLKHWEANARDLQAANDESMTGPGNTRLDEVRKAIDKLTQAEDLDEHSIS